MKGKIFTIVFIVFTATNSFAQGNKWRYFGSNNFSFGSYEVKDQNIWITGSGLTKIDTITKIAVAYNEYNSKILQTCSVKSLWINQTMFGLQLNTME